MVVQWARGALLNSLSSSWLLVVVVVSFQIKQTMVSLDCASMLVSLLQTMYVLQERCSRVIAHKVSGHHHNLQHHE
jgi:hypothetical protein